jgi:1-acyl-sn-glycerol-3-phosphate acyltransferase
MAWNASPDWRSATPAYRFLSVAARGPVRALARLRVRGLEHVPREGPALLASNHMSWADPILINDAIPRPTHWLAKADLFKNAAGHAAMGAFGCIKVDRDARGNDDAVATAVRALSEGKLVGIFPEGTRSPPGEVRAGRTGAARVAALSGAPVVPVGVDATAFWPRDARAPRFGRKAYLAFGAPLALGLAPEDAEDKERLRKATDDIMARVKALFDEAARAREEDARWR